MSFRDSYWGAISYHEVLPMQVGLGSKENADQALTDRICAVVAVLSRLNPDVAITDNTGRLLEVLATGIITAQS